MLQLQPAPPQPSNGSCRVVVEDNASPVVALVDRVTVTCSDWTDHSDTASLLEYHILVNHSAADDGARFDWYPVYRGSRRDVTFYLSQMRGHSAVVNLFVEVVDSLGSARLGLHASVHF